MRKVQRHSPANDMSPLLKTCQICIRAKIRCETTQDSKVCDRCLRLTKICVFVPARRRNVVPRNRIEQLEERLDYAMNSLSPGLEEGQPTSTSGTGYSPPNLQMGPLAASWDPFTRGLLDVDRANGLLNLFRSTMTAHFPFVVVSNTTTLQDLRQQQPCLCLAVLAVAAFEDFVLQRKLSGLFNQVLASRMVVAGKIISFDILQGLLVHLAWAHYQPRPRSYSQHLHIATSIVSDLRLDRQRKPQLWKVDFNNDEGHSTEWGSHELRALIGTYYLTSSSSIVLQKMRHFPYATFILESCEKLEQRAEFPTDKHLKQIVQIQRLSEEVDDIVANGTVKSTVDEANTKLATIRNQLGTFKTQLSFALSECPTLLLQLGMIELVISQRFLPGSPLPAALISASQGPRYNGAQVVDVFSDSILASKSLINILITMSPGQEKILSNLEWITLSCALSFSARLSLLAGDDRISHLTKHLQRSLDIRHTLRQVILRLSSMVSPGEDSSGDRDTFYHFLRRAEAIEAWYMRQTVSLTDNKLQGIADFTLVPDSDASELAGGSMDCQLREMNNQSIMDFFSEEMLGTEIWEPLPLDSLNDFRG
ncbi:hypothetical protein B0H67DRAFT_256615 [Lasiosphaeris hirsuta]|uniref:Zn(2)-C6 fungal-type domain-containing protein n=1 Tax=Lasiosphaeris hirsuta TaxID=260670 RepID=A0AA40DWW9_9PEZI|nr:hypothetical protein B0H67DRAFT_256615 [Lasiosphaeris hirsuta]